MLQSSRVLFYSSVFVLLFTLAASDSSVLLSAQSSCALDHRQTNDASGSYGQQLALSEVDDYKRRFKPEVTPIDVTFPVKKGPLALSGQDKKIVKQAITDARDLAAIAVHTLGSLVGRAEDEQNFINGEFTQFFARAYRMQAGQLKTLIAETYRKAMTVLSQGVAIKWADDGSARCSCQDGGSIVHHSKGICRDRRRLGAFVALEGNDVRKDEFGYPLLFICAWAVRQLSANLARVILHEVIHIADADIKDAAYGAEDCRKLAANQHGMPLLNADTYVEYIWSILSFRAAEKQYRAHKRFQESFYGSLSNGASHSRSKRAAAMRRAGEL